MARFRAFTSDDEDSDAASEASSSKAPTRQSPPRVVKPVVKPVIRPPQTTARVESEDSSSSEDESTESDHDEEESRDSSEMDEDELRPSSPRMDGLMEEESAPWAQQLDLEPHRMHVMQTSLFRMPELAKAQKSSQSFLKHPRSTDTLAEPTSKEIPQRHSFTQPRVQPPARKYVRVSSEDSIAVSHEGAYLDAGLSFGRSFRVGWGPGDRISHVGSLSFTGSSTQTANSSIVNITTVSLSKSKVTDLLTHLLSKTSINPSESEFNDTPSVSPSTNLTFSSFASLFTPQDNSQIASIFRLGQALFDPIDLHLGPTVIPDVRHRVLALRRADALSSWLSRAVAPSVEEDIKTLSTSDSSKLAFLHLSGNQVERAVEVLINGGNVRLATLISQLPGDVDFRADILEQLENWRRENVDELISKDVLKLYSLAAGEIDTLHGGKDNIAISKNLDWLRVFGLHLWFSSSIDTPLSETLRNYEQFVSEPSKSFSRPVPWYSTASKNSSNTTDGLFNIIKLALSPSMTLESALNPLSFTSNPRDYSLPWFLYVILSRCHRLRDFTDRQLTELVDDDGSESQEGISPTADILTINFAAQLQQEGMIQEAAFVLLFLDDEVRRKRAIQELLLRSADLLDEWNVAGLNGSLLISGCWIAEAQATKELYDGNIYRAYELYVEAKNHKAAHELAIHYLAPEAILHGDVQLAAQLFTVLDESLVNDFGVGGQLFIDYASIVTRVPELRQRQQLERDAVPDASEALELELLSGRIPKLIGILPDVLKDKPGEGPLCSAALSMMLSNLLDCLDASKPLKVDIRPGLTDEASRLRHLHSAAYSSLLKTIESVA